MAAPLMPPSAAAPGERPARPLAAVRAVVSGAAGGIGSAIVRLLVAQGAQVHALDRDRAGLARLAADIGADGRFFAHAVDLAERADSARALQALLEQLAGRCDVLVNNAAICRVRPFPHSDDALLELLLAVNVGAPFRLTRTLLPALRASGRGAVVNIASELALIGQCGYTAYSASKGALLAWSRALAVELAADGIRVNSVCPGPTDTAMLREEFAAQGDASLARSAEIASVPLRRLGTPAEIAAVVAFLASDAAAFVSGASWSVDGGKTAR